NAPGKISIVVDCWSTRNGHSFHGILATFVDENWNYQQVVLDFDILVGSHSDKNLATSVFKTLDEYDIKEKLLVITTDNASNMDTMLFELREMLKIHNIDFNIPDQRIRCLAHITNSSCQASLKVLKECNSDGNPGLFEDNNDDSGDKDQSFPPQVNSKQRSNGGKLPNELSVYGRALDATMISDDYLAGMSLSESEWSLVEDISY
ncbi:unnamed protein product, partial [Allacma fusca]